MNVEVETCDCDIDILQLLITTIYYITMYLPILKTIKTFALALPLFLIEKCLVI